MRDPERIDKFLAELGKRWKEVPDWRFGQLMTNIKFERDPFFMEEDEFLAAVDKTFKELGIEID